MATLENALNLLMQGRQRELQEQELSLRQEQEARLADEERRQALHQELLNRISLAGIQRSNAANTPLAQAPSDKVELPGPTPGGDEPLTGMAPRRQIFLEIPGGQRIPLAPLQYKEEAEADALKKKQEETEATYTEVPDLPEFGELAGKRMPASVVNAFFTAKEGAQSRKEVAEINAGARKDAADAAAKAKQEAKDEKDSEEQKQVDAWLDSFESGDNVIGDVPPTLRNKVKAGAATRKIKIPTRKLGEPTIDKLNDQKNLISKLDNLGELESGFGTWSLSKVPDALTQISGLGEKAKIYQPAYFLFAAEMVKALQGSRPSDFDMKTYLNNMPKIDDPPNVKAAKVANLKKQIVGNFNKKLKTFENQGFNVKGFEYEAEPEEEAPAKGAATGASAKPGAAPTGAVEEWVRDPATGKLRRK